MIRSTLLLAALVIAMGFGVAGCGEKKTAGEPPIQLGLGPGETAPYEPLPMPDPVAQAEASPPAQPATAESFPPGAPKETQAAVRPEPAPPAAVATPPAVQGRYTVQKGDTLIKISRRFYNNPAKWKDIWQANRDRIPNPDRIMPGLEIVLP
jgi:nucleoid-associated protein YgaU